MRRKRSRGTRIKVVAQLVIFSRPICLPRFLSVAEDVDHCPKSMHYVIWDQKNTSYKNPPFPTHLALFFCNNNHLFHFTPSMDPPVEKPSIPQYINVIGDGNSSHTAESTDQDNTNPSLTTSEKSITERVSDSTETSSSSKDEAPPQDPPKPPPYTAFPVWRKHLILTLVTAAGFLGPLSGSIYLPILQIVEKEFSISTTVANTTVAVFMFVFAVAVSIKCRVGS